MNFNIDDGSSRFINDQIDILAAPRFIQQQIDIVETFNRTRELIFVDDPELLAVDVNVMTVDHFPYHFPTSLNFRYQQITLIHRVIFMIIKIVPAHDPG